MTQIGGSERPWWNLLALLQEGRQYPRVRDREGVFTPVPRGSKPHQSYDAWAWSPGKNRKEKRRNFKLERKAELKAKRARNAQ